MLSGLSELLETVTKIRSYNLFQVHLLVLSTLTTTKLLYYPDGSYAGINEIVFNFQPWLDWYLKETGQRLVEVADLSLLLQVMVMQMLLLALLTQPMAATVVAQMLLLVLVTNNNLKEPNGSFFQYKNLG